MRKGVGGILTVSGGYIAAVIGAGFASGQEIVSFFVRYGKYGMIGILISCAAFALFSYAVLGVCVERKIYSYTDFLGLVFKNFVIRKAAQAAVFVCSAVSLCVMTACAGEIGKIAGGFREIFGAAAFIVLCGMILFMEARRLMSVNALLGALIIAGIIFTCFYILRFREHQTFSQAARAAVSGFSYAGYNLIGTGALLAGMSRFITSKGDAAISSAVSGAVLFLMITLIWGVLGIYYGQINLGEIPMLTMALRQNNALGVFYGAMLIAAVLTTGISNGFALTDILARKTSYKKAIFFVLLGALAMSGAGFGVLVDTVYRLCGYAGAAIVIMIVISSIFELKNEEK